MKSKRRFTRCGLLATVLSLCLSLTTAWAQRIKISGNVRDADGNPVELVLVQVKQTMNGAMTDEKGFYSLTVAPTDSVVLVFSCLGYHKAERIIPDEERTRSPHLPIRTLPAPPLRCPAFARPDKWAGASFRSSKFILKAERPAFLKRAHHEPAQSAGPSCVLTRTAGQLRAGWLVK